MFHLVTNGTLFYPGVPCSRFVYVCAHACVFASWSLQITLLSWNRNVAKPYIV
uniref:Uncharacterized protein n=1 Tax=Anguilla anguilla TaxID=7936 RepID=A0A0E9X414_ANGAN